MKKKINFKLINRHCMLIMHLLVHHRHCLSLSLSIIYAFFTITAPSNLLTNLSHLCTKSYFDYCSINFSFRTIFEWFQLTFIFKKIIFLQVIFTNDGWRHIHNTRSHVCCCSYAYFVCIAAPLQANFQVFTVATDNNGVPFRD